MDSIIKEDLDRILGDVRSEAFEGKRVLVSGGSGFLGSWICDVLVLSGARVVCLDNLSTGLFENVDHLKGRRGFEFERADVTSHVEGGKFDMVFHLASRPSPEDYQKHPVETALTNSAGTHRMLEVARENDARIFYASSSEVYGDPEMFPTPESYEGRVDPLARVVPLVVAREHHRQHEGVRAGIDLGESCVRDRRRLKLSDPHLANHLALVPHRAAGVDTELQLVARRLRPLRPHAPEDELPRGAGRGQSAEPHHHRCLHSEREEKRGEEAQDRNAKIHFNSLQGRAHRRFP